MKTSKLLALILALVLMFALFAGCGKTEAPPAAEEPAAEEPAAEEPAAEEPAAEEPAAEEPAVEEPAPVESKGTIKIGHLLDKTGTEAATGAQAKTAFDYAVKAFGLVGGYDVEIVEGDCQSNAAAAADLAIKMIEQDEVVAIFGPTQIGHKSAVADALAENGVPLILYNGTPFGMTKKSPWVVGVGGSTAQFPTVMADYAYNELGYRKVYTMAQDMTGGHNYVDPFVENFTALGGEVVEQMWIPMGTTELAPFFASMSEEADALVGWTSSSDGIAMWKEWYNSGTYEKMPILATMHGGFTDFYIMKALDGANPDIVKAILESGTYAPIMYCYSIDSDANNEFVEGWKAEFGTVPGGNNLPGSCYQAIRLLDEALTATGGDYSPDALIAACLAVDFAGPEGHVVFPEGVQCATKDIHVAKVVQLEDGSYNYEVVKTYEDISPMGLKVG